MHRHGLASAADVALRGVKAGGWGVVNTEFCSVHPTSDNEAFANATLWNDEDVRVNRLMTDAVHEHGALPGSSCGSAAWS